MNGSSSHIVGLSRTIPRQLPTEIADDTLCEISLLLNLRRAVNMSMYKDNYVKRRIAIRMRSTSCENADHYCHILRSSEEELDLLERYMPVPVLDKEALKRDYDELGQDGIMRGFVWGDQGGCWQHAACLMGTEELIMAAADKPDWVLSLLEALWRKKERFIEESLSGAAYDLVETGGGAASSTVISPKYFDKFCLPFDRKMHDALHATGHKAVYHTCGGMMPILERVVANGCDASETLTPPEMGGDARPRELKRRIGAQVALIGGLDQNTYLEEGDRESISSHVHYLFETYGENGGYIMSPSDHFFHVPVASLEAYAEAAKECVYK